MPRRTEEHSGITWGDVLLAWERWERDYGIEATVALRVKHRMPQEMYLEIVMLDADPSTEGLELLRTRAPFDAPKGAGHAGRVMHALFEAFNLIDLNPWYWSTKMRRSRVQ